ncbi:MAG: hypothetical protein C0483_10645 [Pirellula sp.]|nr:hypothetical protein [Pirellula sp.]
MRRWMIGCLALEPKAKPQWFDVPATQIFWNWGISLVLPQPPGALVKRFTSCSAHAPIWRGGIFLLIVGVRQYVERARLSF